MRRHALIASASLAIVAPLMLADGPAAGLRAVPIGPLPPEPEPVSLRQPGDGRDPVCDGRRLPVFEQRVLAAQAFRQDMGFRSDREYVERSLRDPSFRPVEGFEAPMSWPERRHIREWTYFNARPVSRYVTRYARAISGGISIESRYPGVSAAVHLTADFERHAEGLGRLSVPSQVVPVRFTEAELTRKTDEVSGQIGHLRREGVHVSAVSTDISTNSVDVDLVSRRPDAAAVIESRFGPAVRAHVHGTSRFRPLCVPAGRYRTGRTGRTLRVTWQTDSFFRFSHLEVREETNAVSVGVIERAPFFEGLVAVSRSRIVRLKGPLGTRRVLDGETGRPLRKLRRSRR